jgi:hypothetical protein
MSERNARYDMDETFYAEMAVPLLTSFRTNVSFWPALFEE